MFKHIKIVLKMNKYKFFLITFLGIVLQIDSFSQSFILQDYNKIKSIGYAHSEYDTITQRLYSKYYADLNIAIKNTFKNDIGKINFQDFMLKSESIDTSQIIKICKEQQLDAFLVTKIYFLQMNFLYKGFLALDNINKQKFYQQGAYPCYVEIKIFDNSGQLILWSESFPMNGYTPREAIQSGLINALKKAKKIK